jgi:putative transposase
MMGAIISEWVGGIVGIRTLQKFVSVHASVHNHFSHERHLVSRKIYRERRSAALAQWRAVMT